MIVDHKIFLFYDHEEGDLRSDQFPPTKDREGTTNKKATLLDSLAFTRAKCRILFAGPWDLFGFVLLRSIIYDFLVHS